MLQPGFLFNWENSSDPRTGSTGHSDIALFVLLIRVIASFNPERAPQAILTKEGVKMCSEHIKFQSRTGSTGHSDSEMTNEGDTQLYCFNPERAPQAILTQEVLVRKRNRTLVSIPNGLHRPF